jgi:hypothetical protein
VQQPSMKFPVTCPECAAELLTEFPVPFIANALATGKGIRLYASCHDTFWTATFLERQKLREYLGAMRIEAQARISNAEQPTGYREAESPLSSM